MNLRYLLTSNFPLPGNEAIADYLRRVGIGGPIAWMAPRHDPVRFAEAQRQFGDLGFDRLIDIYSGAYGWLNRSAVSALYLSGGNPLLFRERLRETGLRDWIKGNATSADPIPVIGASGGAMQLSSNLSVFRLLSEELPTVLTERRSYRGLALVQLEVAPHFDRQLPDLRALLPRYASSAGGDVWGVDDGAGLACLGDGSKVGVGSVTRFGGG